MGKGFTLIELLVVVLIIGILAAANDKYTENFNDLEITPFGTISTGNPSYLSWDKNQCILHHSPFGWVWCVMPMSKPYSSCGWRVWLDHSNKPGKIACVFGNWNAQDPFCEETCKATGFDYNGI